MDRCIDDYQEKSNCNDVWKFIREFLAKRTRVSDIQDGNKGPEKHIHCAFQHEPNCGHLNVVRFKPGINFLRTVSLIVEPSENDFSHSQEDYVKKNWDSYHADPDYEIRPTVASLIEFVIKRGTFREPKYILDEPFSLEKVKVC